MEKLLILGMVTLLGASVFGKRPPRTVEPIPPLPAKNRAPLARATASSLRLQRLEEIQGGARGIFGSISLYAPQIQPQCKPAYAADGSPLTQWATDRKGPQYLQYDFGNRRQERAPLAGGVIRWGDDFARAWAIQVSDDGRDWRTVKEENSGRGRIEKFELQGPVSARFVRLLCLKSARGKGFAVNELVVYGAKEEAPPGVSKLWAEAKGPDRIELAWEAPTGSNAYLFQVHRSTDPKFTPGPENLIASEDGLAHTDFGLDPGVTYYYAVVSESFSGQTSRPAARAAAATLPGKSFSRLRWQGVIEGFYNDPWPHPERLRMLAFLEDAGFNAYIYAPKVEPYHRQLWREPYPAEELKNFAELEAAAKAHRITFIFALSPGMDMDYENPAEIERLKQKFKPLFDLGVRAFTVALDDIPDSRGANGAMAKKQAAMVNEIYRWFTSLDPQTVLFFCPTVYNKSYEYQAEKKPAFAEYLRGLKALDPNILIFWTGPAGVFSETIDLASARGLRQVYGRKILIWDNYPVNDGGLRRNLFLGPYTGRAPDLGEAAAGIFLNPMYLPNANYLPLYTAGRYFRDPDYEPEAAYQAGLRFVAGAAGAAALKPLADAQLSHPLYPDRGVAVLPLSRAIEEFWQAGGQGEARERLRRLFESYTRNPEELAATVPNFALVQELLPASQKLALSGRAGLRCLDYLEASDPGRREALRREIEELREQSRQNPWHVADSNVSVVYRFLLGAKKKGVVMEQFIRRTLRGK